MHCCIRKITSIATICIAVLFQMSSGQGVSTWISAQDGHTGTPPADPSPEVIINDQGRDGLEIQVNFKGVYITPVTGTIKYSPPPATDYNPSTAITATVTFNNVHLPEGDHLEIYEDNPSFESYYECYSVNGINIPPGYRLNSFDYQVDTISVDYVPFEPMVPGAPDVLQGPPILHMGGREDMSKWGAEIKSYFNGVDTSSGLQIYPIGFSCDKTSGTVVRKLLLVRSVRLRYTFAEDPLPDEARFRDIDVLAHKRMVSSGLLKMMANDAAINPKLTLDAADDIYEGMSAVRNGSVLIISSSIYTEAVTDLAEWLMRKGYQVKQSFRDFSSGWDSTTVQDTINHYFNNTDSLLESIILFGSSKKIQSKLSPKTLFHNSAPSDIVYLKYADFDHAERIPIARIPIEKEMDPAAVPQDCINQANNIVTKILSYQKTPPNVDNIYSTITTAAIYSNEKPSFDYDYLDLFEGSYRTVKSLQNSGYSVNELYDNYRKMSASTKLYFDEKRERELPSSISFNIGSNDVVDAINAGTGLVWYTGHGARYGWSCGIYPSGAQEIFTKSIFSLLTNHTFNPVVFSLCCESGTFGRNFAQQLLGLPTTGASGVFAASRAVNNFVLNASTKAIQYLYTPNSPSAAIPVGWLLNQTKFYAKYTDGLNFHYFGDPTMRIWTQNPHHNPVTISSVDKQVIPNKTFSVTYSGIPDQYKKHATATLFSTGFLLGSDNGDGRIMPDCKNILVPGEAMLTITAPNCLPVIDVKIPIVDDINTTYLPLRISRYSKNFAIYGSQKVTVNDRAIVYTSDTTNYAAVGAGNLHNSMAALTMGSYAKVGNVVCNGKVQLRSFSRVYGNVISQTDPELQAGYIVDGQIISGYDFDTLTLELDGNIPTGTMNINVPDRNTWDLTPDLYNEIIIGNGATVTVHSGVYYASKLEIRPDAKLNFNLTSGPAVFMIDGKINVYSNVTITGDDGSNILFVSGHRASSLYDYGVYIAPHVKWHGTIAAPYSNIKFDSGIDVYGALLGASVEINPDSRFVHIPFAY